EQYAKGGDELGNSCGHTWFRSPFRFQPRGVDGVAHPFLWKGGTGVKSLFETGRSHNNAITSASVS
ncbi:MAG TPA: hypothetical protein VFD70_00960, partial [Anaerolineae bacterium]|nr:hypothetical protein [Anaerolineae bacterium]